MTRRLVWLAVVVSFTDPVAAQGPERGPGPREVKPQWQRLLAGDDAQKAEDLEKQVDAAARAGKRDEARKLAEDLLALRTRLQGADHWQVRDARNAVEFLTRPLSADQRTQLAEAERLGERVLALYGKGQFQEAVGPAEQVLKIRKDVLGEKHPETAGSMDALGTLYETLGKSAEAEPLHQQALKIHRELLGDRHPTTAVSLNNLAALYQRQGDFARAEPLHREALAIRKEALGDKDPNTALTLNNLAALYESQAKYPEAERMYKEALQIRKAALGDKHPDTATSLNNLAILHHYTGRYAEAESLCKEALRIRTEVLGEAHPDTAVSLNNLAGLYTAQGRHAEAEPLYQKALRIRRAVFGDRHPATAACVNNLASLYHSQGKYAEAEPLYTDSLRVKRATLGEKHPEVALALNNLAEMYIDQKKYDQAEPLCTEAVRISKEVLGENHPDTALAVNNLAGLYQFQGKYDQAEPLFRESLRVKRELLGDRHPDTALARSNLALLYVARDKFPEAEALYQEAIKVHRAVLGDKHPGTANSQTSLAFLYAAQGKYAEAEPLLIDAVRGYEAGRLARARSVERAVGPDARTPYLLLAAAAARLGKPAAAFAALEADLARGLLDELATRTGGRLPAAEEKERAEMAVRLKGVEARVLRLATLPKPSADEQKELAALTAERRQKEDALAKLAADLSRRAVAELKAVQAALDPAAALVAWVDVVSADRRVQEHWACVLRHTGEPKWEPLPGTGEGGKWSEADSELPGRLRAALRGQTVTAAEVDALAAAVRAQRLAPVEKHLAGVKRLLVVGVNEMAGLPVELLAPGFQVEYVPSGTTLARAAGKPKPAAPASVLAVGDPVFPPPGPVKDPPLPPGGLLIMTVVEGGAAFNVLRAGDVLLTYGGAELTDVPSLGKAIAAKAGEKVVPVKVWRVSEKGEGVAKTIDLPPGRLGVILAPEPARDALAARHKADQQLAALSHSGKADPATGKKEPWKELPGTAVELGRLRDLFGENATVLARSEASEQRLDELRKAGQLKGYRYLHFATHGLANNDRAFESFLVLAQDKLPKFEGKEGEKPYNGELSAREVLDGWAVDADLVTLSACESGLGQRGGGDGLLGFTQAFLVAGARSVCLTLWEVDDTATALLMDRFYHNLLGKRDGLDKPMKKAAALREAKEWLKNLTADEVLKLSADMHKGVTRGKGEDLPPVVEAKAVAPKGDLTVKPYAHPRFWAAFILVGDPD